MMASQLYQENFGEMPVRNEVSVGEVHLYPAEQFLLIALASHLHRVDTAGLLQWTSECLGMDGVIVDEIAENLITGQGEWNPPGGWKPFQVNVHTGKIHTHSKSL
jgi:hypothetical protein